MKNSKDRVVLITGAAHGIGLSLAKRYEKRGAFMVKTIPYLKAILPPKGLDTTVRAFRVTRVMDDIVGKPRIRSL